MLSGDKKVASHQFGIGHRRDRPEGRHGVCAIEYADGVHQAWRAGRSEGTLPNVCT